MVRSRASLAIMFVTIVSGLLWGEQVTYGQASADSAKNPVAGIEVRGNIRIETATLLSRIKTREGEAFSPAIVREDIKSLFQLGFFSDVRVESEPSDGGVKVIYIVTERPFVVDVDFVGNRAILTDKLKEKITIRKQAFLDDVQVKANAEALKQAYDDEGYYNTTVIPVLKTHEDKVTLLFYIKEGAKAVINRVDFEGRQAFKPRVLQKQIDTRAYSRFSSWLTSSGYYKKTALDEDIERLKDYYQNNGYLQVQVGSPLVEFKDDRSFANVPYPLLHGELDYLYEFYFVRAFVTFPLIEGDQYRLQSIAFEGQHVFETDELKTSLKLKEGDLFRRNALREGVGAIHDLYGEKGYLYASVVPQYDADPVTKTVKLTISITEDNPMRVRQILISGNDKTRDKVIRRELRVQEQELVDTKQLRRSFQRINNLNFFDSVDIAPERMGSDEVDLQVRVKEKSTGALSAGGGYSSVDRLVGMFEVTQGNLFGRGQLLRARTEFGKIRRSYSLTFREPYLLDYPVSGTVSLYNQQRDYKTYKSRNIGGDLILGKSFTEYVSGSLSYSWQSTRISDLDPITANVPLQIRDQQGTTDVSSISTTLAYDTRDFYFDPKEGTRAAVTQEL
ncbi:MAG TPA: outer membrane protein assembly factor BamA, partial [Nitrospiria bacterium]